jgi:soluble lytic murein transglycosylase-like protein
VNYPETVAAVEAPKAPVRRSRKPWTIALAVLAAAVMMAATACTPKEVALVQIEPHFGAQTGCALRVVDKESSFNPSAVSPGGGNIGLFQINTVHRDWVRNTYGYSMDDLKNGAKNAEVAKGLFDDAQRRTGDGWSPWRFSGANSTGCPA